MCRPSCEQVFGRRPCVSEPLCNFSGSYPLPLCREILEIQLPAIISMRERDVSTSRAPHQPPRWVGDLGQCLRWQKLLQYRFCKVNHINVNEQLSYRSLIKHLAKTSPSSKFVALLDSRVVIGCNSKGRSSSTSLNYHMSTTLPYLVGGNLYPAHIHVGTHDNASDDPSRLAPLRSPPSIMPLWLSRFLSGAHQYLTAARIADDCAGVPGRWARLVVVRLALLGDASPPPGLTGPSL